MRSPRLLDVLVLGLSALSVAEATVVNLNGRLALHNGVAIQRRQGGGGTGTPNDPTSSSSSSSSTTPPPTPSPTPSPPSNTPTPTPTPTPTRSSSSSSSSTSQSSSITTPTTTPPPETSSTSESLTTFTSTSVITTTGSDGQQTTITTATTVTSTPGLANGNSNAQTGMTAQTRNTVIGVVVGVGGAIILGGLAFVAWRIWGRKKAVEENDDLDYPSTAGGEKPDTGNSMNGRTPFQSTLESYHAPTQVNTASNF